MMELRPYQRESVQAIREQWDAGDPNALLVLATGLGKTIVFSMLGKEMRREGLRRVLVLAHRRELVSQAVDKWNKVDPGESVGVYQGACRDLHADVIVASVQSCYPDRYAEDPCPNGCDAEIPDPFCAGCGGEGVVKTLTRRGRIHELPLDEIDLIIIDEVHHVTRASLYVEVIVAVREKNPSALLLGVTATPFRTDGKGLGLLFRGVAYAMDIFAGVRCGWLAPLVGRRVELDIDLSEARTSRTTGDYIDEDLGHVMDTPEARREVVQAWIEHAGPDLLGGGPRGRRTAAFCPTVAAASHLCESFVEAGVDAAWIANESVTPKEERRDILRRYAAGEIQVIVNVGVLTEGWDDPGTRCILVARPTKARGLYIQIVGRGTRLDGLSLEASIANGKADCLVIDCTGATGLGLMTLADLTVEREPMPPDEDDEEEEEEEEFEFPPEPVTRRVVGHSTYDIDLFGGVVHWARVNGSRVATIDVGRTVVVFPSLDGNPPMFSAIETGQAVAGIKWLARDEPETDTLRAAEIHAMERGKGRYLQPGSWFTHRAASESQRALVQRLLAWSKGRGLKATVDPARMSMALASAWIGYLKAREAFWHATH